MYPRVCIWACKYILYMYVYIYEVLYSITISVEVKKTDQDTNKQITLEMYLSKISLVTT